MNPATFTTTPAPSGHRATVRVGVGLTLLALSAAATACTSGANDTDALAPTSTISVATTAVPVSPTQPPVTSTTIAAPAVSTIAPVTLATSTTRPTRVVDELVGAEGWRTHIRCVGEGDTTVVLIAGFGGDSTNWSAVEPTIADHARVCSYDRPGTGTSDPATTTATFATQATELRALLDTVGEPGPYLVVGHSFGGAQAATFAARYPDQVIGVVLVDASPVTWPTALCAVAADGSQAASTVRDMCSTGFDPAGNPERLDVAAAFAEAATIPSLGSIPLAVITATERELPAGLAATEVTRLTDAWNEGQQHWMALSSTSHLVPVEDTGHHIEIDRPAVVIDEITQLIP